MGTQGHGESCLSWNQPTREASTTRPPHHMHVLFLPEPPSTKCMASTQYGIADFQIRVYSVGHFQKSCLFNAAWLKMKPATWQVYWMRNVHFTSSNQPCPHMNSLRPSWEAWESVTNHRPSAFPPPCSSSPALPPSPEGPYRAHGRPQTYDRIWATGRTYSHLSWPALPAHVNQHWEERFCSIFKYIEQRNSLICLCKGWLSPKFTVTLFL